MVTSTVDGLRHAVAQQPGPRFPDEFQRLDVGFAVKKGTPPAPAFRTAVNRLKKDGTHHRIPAKRGTTPSAADPSRIGPPEIR